PPNKEFSDADFVEGFADRGVSYVTGPGEDAGADAPVRGGRGAAAEGAAAGRGRGPAPAPTPAPAAAEGAGGGGLNPQGLPFLKPPYGQITAINMDKGEFVWQVAHGETPDAVRNSPVLKGM